MKGKPHAHGVVLAFAFFACTLLAGAGTARPTTPLLLADFEKAGSEALWRGVAAERTATRAAEGQYGLSFEISRWEEGREPRPGVRLAFAGGRGFPTQDFSRYAALALDVWVEGDAPARLGLKLLDEKGEDSWTQHTELQPGKWNQIVLEMAEAGADCDVHHVAEVVLYALRSTNRFTAVIDNLRLLPKAAPAIARFELRYPNYRNWIFPGERPVEVTCEVEAQEYHLEPRKLTLELVLNSSAGSRTVRAGFRQTLARAILKLDGLLPGDVTLEARLTGPGGRELAKEQWPARMLTAKEVAGLKAYVDGQNRFHLDGAPFFPIGWYGSVNTQHLAELASGPFNCLLAYGTDNVPKKEMLSFLDAMQARKLKLIYCLNDVYPTATYFEGKTWEGISGNDAIAEAIVAAYRDHPAIIAWYLNDELPHRLVPRLTEYYTRVKQVDPGRPNFIVLCNRSELPYFPGTTDIFGVDPYPIPHDPITRVSDFMEAARAAVRDRQCVWLVPQAFAWYQYNSKNPDRGHAPTPDELRTGRAPTREEERCMTYLGLIHGAKGLIYYCYYDFRVLPQYAEMWAWMKSIAGEVRELTPALLSAETTGSLSVSAPNLHTSLKRHEGRYYLMAANPGSAACTAEFAVKGGGSGEVSVRFEGRKLKLRRGRFHDNFAPLAVHVYEWTP